MNFCLITWYKKISEKNNNNKKQNNQKKKNNHPTKLVFFFWIYIMPINYFILPPTKDGV